MALGCDINGDGEIDNQLGKVLGALKAASQQIDIQAAVTTAFRRGDVLMLQDIEFDPTLAMTQVAGLRSFVGAHDATDGLTAPAFYMGQGHFTVVSEHGSGMGGAIQGGVTEFGPNDAVLQLTLVPNGRIMTLPLERAYVSGSITATTITNGRLCGAIAAPIVLSTFIPQLADALSDVAKTHSIGESIWMLFDDDHSCDTDPDCAPSSSNACHCITATELDNNSIIRSILTPDLDLDGHATNPFVTDQCDPTYRSDALSVGVGFGANQATFALP